MKIPLILILLLISPFLISQNITLNDSLIHQLNTKLDKIDTNNIDLTALNDISLDDIEVKLNEINYRLNTAKAGPENKYNSILLFQLDLLQQRTNKLRKIIDRQNATLEILYYNKAISLLQDNSDKANAEKYLEKSLENNHLYIPSLYELAHIYYEEGELKKSSELILILLNKTYPTGNIYDSIISFGNSLYESFIINAESLNHQEKFSDAEDLLAEASLFCKSNSIIKCNDNLTKTLTDTKYGMYKSYLNIAESGINSHHPDIAESFIFSALNYKKKNIEYLNNYNEAENMFEQIIDSYLESASKAIDKRNYKKAMKYFETASVLCDSLGGTDCNRKISDGINSIKTNVYNDFVAKAYEYFKKGNPDIAEGYINRAKSYKKENVNDIRDSSRAENLLKQIKYINYRKLIQKAARYYKAGDCDSSMKSLDGADDLEARYALNHYSKKDSLEKNVAKLLIKKKISTVNIKIWGNDLAEATNIVNLSGKMQERYYLKNDTEVSKWIDVLEQKILKKNCDNDRNDYDVLVFKAGNSLQKRDYIEAEYYYREAADIAKKHPPCKLNTTFANDSYTKYQPPANYQKLLAEADYLYQKKDYSQCIREYLAAENLYSLMSLNTCGLNHVSFHYYILNKKNNPLFIATASYYIENNNYDEALGILKTLEVAAYPKDSACVLQQELAKKLAKRDYDLKKSTDLKANLKSYNSNTRWFRCFNKKYRKEIAKLTGKFWIAVFSIF